MRIDKLEKDMIIKSYKQLCEILEIKVTGGTSKQAQIKEFESYVKYRKEGHKFIIEEIYNKQKPIKDGRSLGNNNLYADNIEKLVLDLLAHDDNKGTISVSVGRMLEMLNMINSNYRYCRQNIPKLSTLLDVSESDVYEFYNYTHSKVKSGLKRALEKLRNKRLVYVTPYVTISIKDEKGNTIHRPAEEKELEDIVKAEKMTMEEMQFPNIQAICTAGKYKEWKQNVNRKLYNWREINYYYECYRITNYKAGVIKLLDEIERQETRTNLNESVKTSAINTAQRKHDKLRSATSFGTSKHERKRAYQTDYVDNIKRIADTVIAEDAPKVEFTDN